MTNKLRTIIVSSIIILFLWLESTLTTLPLILIAVTIFFILYKQIWILWIAFIGGLVLDAGLIHPLGSTGIFIVLWLLIILLYERKYEIDSYPFIIISSFIGTAIFLFAFNYREVWIQAIISTIISLIIYSILRNKKRK